MTYRTKFWISLAVFNVSLVCLFAGMAKWNDVLLPWSQATPTRSTFMAILMFIELMTLIGSLYTAETYFLLDGNERS